MKKTIFVVLSVALLLAYLSCKGSGSGTSNPEVRLFVEHLRSGTFHELEADGTAAMPKFSTDDIGELLEYADDISEIPSFPLTSVSYSAGGKPRLGECILWTVETLRLGHKASMGCKLVYKHADDYEGIYFLTDDEVREVVARYRRWWKAQRSPMSILAVEGAGIDPLTGSKYMWW